MSAHNRSSFTNISSPPSQDSIAKKLDEEFVLYMLEVEGRYQQMSKHERIRIENWVRKSLPQSYGF